jgi:hypothetical protein
MSKYIFIFVIVLVFSASCGSNSAATPVKTKILKLDKEGFKECPIEMDIPVNWHLNGIEDIKFTAHIGADIGGQGGIIIMPLTADKCITDLAALKASSLLYANYDHTEATITEDIKLKNGFGIRYNQPLPFGKVPYKYFIVFIQVKGKCYIIENSDFDDRQLTQWDAEKAMIESIR